MLFLFTLTHSLSCASGTSARLSGTVATVVVKLPVVSGTACHCQWWHCRRTAAAA